MAEVGDALDGAGSLLADSAPLTETTDGFRASVAGAEVVLPSDPAELLVLDGGSGAITVALPEVAGVGVGAVDDSGAVVYESAEGPVSFAAQATDEGGLQVLAVIESADAPTEYRFDLQVPVGATLMTSPGGGVDIVGADGVVLSTVSPPWAIDAAGRMMASKYHIDGSTIVQTVDHRGAAYPVVADPEIIYGDLNGFFKAASYTCKAWKVTCSRVVVTTTTAIEDWYESSSYCGNPSFGLVDFGCVYARTTFSRKFKFVATAFDTKNRVVGQWTGVLTKVHKKWCGAGVCGSNPAGSLGIGETQVFYWW
jgi:hypothetical protein